MSETAAWLIVQQPNGLFARYVAAQGKLTETDMTQADALTLLCITLGVPESIAPEKIHNAIAAGYGRWQRVNKAIASRRACQGVA